MMSAGQRSTASYQHRKMLRSQSLPHVRSKLAKQDSIDSQLSQVRTAKTVKCHRSGQHRQSGVIGQDSTDSQVSQVRTAQTVRCHRLGQHRL